MMKHLKTVGWPWFRARPRFWSLFCKSLRVNRHQGTQPAKAAFPHWNGRLAPVFDTARRMLVVSISSAGVKQTDQPLSIIPEYTLNTSLDWQATQALSFYLTGTFYGEQESASRQSTTGAAMNPDVREAYSLWGLSGRYRITPKVSVSAGVNNLLDKRLFRETNSNTAAGGANASAATYNEPGRAFFAAFNVGF